MELTIPKHRTIIGIASQAFFAMGYMLLSLIAYFERYWRHLLASLILILLFKSLYTKKNLMYITQVLDFPIFAPSSPSTLSLAIDGQ